MGGPDRVENLIEAPLMRNGEVLPQAAGRLEAEDTIQITARQPRPMQIGGLGRLDREAPIADRQPRLHELIRGLDRGDSSQA